MAVDHTAYQLACRARLVGLVACTTGVTSLAATATGYMRTSGSFLAEGFAAGMEVTPAGFATNRQGVILEATDALNLVVAPFARSVDAAGVQTVTRPAMVVEAAAGGRSLTVGLPTFRQWENRKLEPVPGLPYVEEQYIPGPESLDTTGSPAVVTVEPMYSPRVYVPENTGITGDGKYADAIKTLFAAKVAMALASGDMLRVRTKPAPFRGQRGQSATPGWSVVPITIPLRIQTTNPL